ncbi:MAG: hypothetical protein B7Z40_16845 [Bosea sp. 12-68-7]|nr:MAG: hypothetical protein B7Z40_16845 [Bosea sp. 12-68-7]OYW99371.1 MAG: hypothetical protein B7Z14_12115 [Bosea sp. 32-68-6]
MNQIMWYNEWMKLTAGGKLDKRSPVLKTLDAALLKHEQQPNPANRQALVKALHAWINSQGSEWQTSIRNRRNAVETLFRQLGPEGGQVKPDRAALAHVFLESELFVAELFKDKQIMWRPGILTKIAGNSATAKVKTSWTMIKVGTNSRKLHKLTTPATPASAPGLASQFARMLTDEIIPPEVRVEVMQMLALLMPSFMAELTAACAPFVGVGTSAVMTTYGVYKMVEKQYKLDMALANAARTLSTGDPEAAFAAIIRMLQREQINLIAGVSVGYAAFGAKLVSLLVDGGAVTNTAISLTQGLIKLLMLARIAVRDVMERKEANKLLAQGDVDAQLFTASPLMGAYLICCAPTSVIVNTVIDHDAFARPGMMDRVERAVKLHIEPMKAEARRLVTEHRMYIPELEKHAGIIEKNKGNIKKTKAAMYKTVIGNRPAAFGG